MAHVEGEIVKISDAVAYLNHDIEDAIRAGVITGDDLPREAVKILGDRHSKRVNTMVCDIIESSWDVRVGDIIKKRPAIKMSAMVIVAAEELNSFLFERVYNVHSARKETQKARQVLRFLYQYYLENEGEMPPEYRLSGEPTARRVVDYIAGMTDQFALNKAKEIKRK